MQVSFSRLGNIPMLGKLLRWRVGGESIRGPSHCIGEVLKVEKAKVPGE